LWPFKKSFSRVLRENIIHKQTGGKIKFVWHFYEVSFGMVE
jgi:hypothetical protein